MPQLLRRARALLTTRRARRTVGPHLHKQPPDRPEGGRPEQAGPPLPAALLAAPGIVSVEAEGGLRAARSGDSTTVLRAREENLRVVERVLETAGVEYFAVRGYSSRSAVVGVPAQLRDAVMGALAREARTEPLYASAQAEQSAIGYAGQPGTWAALTQEQVIRVTVFHASETDSSVLGTSYGCDIEFWREEGDELVAPRNNRITDRLPRCETTTEAPGHLFTEFACADNMPPLQPVRTRKAFTMPLATDVHFPVDAVYTWVDGSDPSWQLRRNGVEKDPYHPQADCAERYQSRDELRYSLRSLERFAPWIRRVYLVTDQQIPSWLNTDHPKVTVVDHREIFTNPDALPTFNSHAIESQLHHIPGLSEHFLYFNDDFFLGRSISPGGFFLANGTARYFPSRALLPIGPPTPEDEPVSVAGRNNRALLEARFGTVITQKMKHAPCALQRSTLYEIEEAFAAEHDYTARSKFRSEYDLSIPTSLHPHYAFLTGRAIPATLRYEYIALSAPDAPLKMQRLLRKRHCHAFCLNDVAPDSPGQEGQEGTDPDLLADFLQEYFPRPSLFEKDTGMTHDWADARHLGNGQATYASGNRPI
ncbi:stealth family protein [Streptomyces endophyticus]|uniref:Stealth family protein n=1 Tax=Streptomyces endophyticus TaxID=714166 RepID=A0ABU6F684_9ACTN|nr:stealth family protein [Streptomyces endophyticus]MEB8339532.1 stealth family protein [Streptomyces endophyticus]